MATISLYSRAISKGVLKTTWGPFTATSDVGTALNAPGHPDKTISARATGAFFLGATVTIEGSNNSATGPFAALNDSRGESNTLTFTTTDIKVCNENALFIRPRITTATAAATRKIYIDCISQGTRR